MDMQLIWDNCKSYNIAGSDIYKLAEEMEKVCKKAINEAKEELQLSSKSRGGVEEQEEVSFEDKVSFTEKVRRLTNQGLTRLVTRVKELCKDALEDVDAEKLHIQVDKIDSESFRKLVDLVDENLVKGAQSQSKNKDPSSKRQRTE